MANIFKSKEIFKKVDPAGARDPQLPVPIVRGVYVAGPYRPPYYISHTLTVTNTNGGRAAIVVPYTSVDVSMYQDNMIQMVDIDINNTTIVNYLTASTSTYQDNMIQFLDLDITTPMISEWKTTVVSMYQDNMIQLLNVDINNITIEPFITIFTKMPVEQPLVNLLNIGSSAAIITNGE